MANSLGLDDDLDGVELVRDIERAFQIKITDEEATNIFVVGELHELLVQKLSTDEGGRKCASAMAFYRLRNALRRQGIDHQLVPQADIRFLEPKGIKVVFARLEA